MTLQIDRPSADSSDEGIRIHYQIPTVLHHRLKAEAALRGITLKDFVIVSLEKAVEGLLLEAK